MKPISNFLKVTFLLNFLALGCGSENKLKKCEAKLLKTGSSVLPEGVEVSYKGNFSSDCNEIFTKTTSSNFSVSYAGQPTGGAYLKNLSVGQRTKAFGSNYSLETGTIRSEFRGEEYQDWKLPWADKPALAQLTIQLPTGTTEENLTAQADFEISTVIN
jgi:hypothetical protein